MTKAQRKFLELASRVGGLAPDAVTPGSSYSCVQRMMRNGLLERWSLPSETTRKYFPTAAGLKALSTKD